MFKFSTISPSATYQVTSNKSSSNEGAAVVVSLQTTGVQIGQAIPFLIVGNGITVDDFVGLSSLSGQFVVDINGQASVELVVSEDAIAEGLETFELMLFNGSRISVDVNDTSTTPAAALYIGGVFTFDNPETVDPYYTSPYGGRLNTDGSYDSTFNIGTGFNNAVNSVAIQPDGKIICGGFFTTYQGTARNYIVRLNTDGSYDSTFNIGTGFNSNVTSIAIQPDGKIVVGGGFTTYQGTACNYIVRLNTDGSYDSTFNIGTGFNSGVNSVAIQPDGKIVVGGLFTSYQGTAYNRIVRLNTDGSYDSTFNIGTGFNSGVNSIAIQSDGKIVVGGFFTTYQGTAYNRIVRLNTDGSYDSTFNIGTGFNSNVTSIAIQPDGKIVVVGEFTTYQGTAYNRIARLNTDGSYDSTFNIGTGFNSGVNSIAIQPDGKIICGGAFTTYQGTAYNRIARLNTDGSYDSTFNIGTGFNSTVISIAIQSDGKIVVGGSFASYQYVQNSMRGGRLNTDGSYDSTFNIGTGFNNTVYSIAIQSDGKIVVGGGFTTYQGTARNYIARLNTDGSYDSTFNIGTGFNSGVNSVAIQPDGKIVVGGAFTTYQGTAYNRIARLNTDGSYDSTFNVGAGFNTIVRSIAIQSDGKIVVGGDFTTYQGTTYNRIARLNTDGSYDSTFNIGTGFGGYTTSIAIQSDGKIVVGGQFTSYQETTRNRIARLNTDGSYDSTFNIGTGFNSTVSSIAIQPDGKIVVGGGFTTYQGTAYNRIARLNTDGSYDSTFNVGAGFDSNVNSVAIQPDGKIVVGGAFTTYQGTVSCVRAGRLNTNGSYDSAFNTNNGFNDFVSSIAIQPDGKIVVGGHFATYQATIRNRIARLNTDGSYDSTFNIGTGFNGNVNSIAIQPDGKIVVVGQFTAYQRTACNYIVRLNTDGSYDSTFNIGTGFNSNVISIAIQSDGKIVVGGAFTTYQGTAYNRIARLNTDGSYDSTFNVGAGFSGQVNSVAIQPDGKIVVGGLFTSYQGTAYNRIVRLNTDGSYDSTFNIGTGFNSGVNSIAIQSDGKIVVGGAFTTYQGTAYNRIARLNTDGSYDSTFNIGTGFNSNVTSIAIQPDGKIVVGGFFTTYQGTARNYIARLNTDGSYDSTFNIGTGFSGQVSSIAIQPDGKIICGGQFTVYQETTRNRIVRLNTDGSYDSTFNIGTGFNSTVSSIAL